MPGTVFQWKDTFNEFAVLGWCGLLVLKQFLGSSQLLRLYFPGVIVTEQIQQKLQSEGTKCMYTVPQLVCTILTKNDISVYSGIL